MGNELSQRQSEVLRLAATGQTDKEIAQELGIAPGTVASHWKRLRAHFGTSSRTEVVARVLAGDSEEQHSLDVLERDRLLFEIAERDRLEDRLREANEKLEEVIHSREELLAKTLAAYELQQTKMLRRLEELETLNRIVCDFGIIVNEGVHGTSWRKTWVSEAMNQYGYTQEEVLSGQVTIFNTIIPEDLAHSLDDYQKGVNAQRVLATHRFITKDGQHRHFMDFLRLMPTDDSGLGTAHMVAIDVTDWVDHIRHKVRRGWPDLPLNEDVV